MGTKKVLSMMLVALFGLASVFSFSSCSQDEMVSNVEASNVQGKITLSDFPSNKVFAEDNYHEVFSKQGIGGSDKTAIVTLLFGQDGFLYTKEKYNSQEKESDEKIKRYVTDLETFKSVTGCQYADPKYSKSLPYDDKTSLWIFDPYQKFYKTNEEIQSELSTGTKDISLRASVSLNIQPGDILYVPNVAGSAGIYFGHVGGIYLVLNNTCQDLTAFMNSTTVVEADVPKVFKRKMNVYWGNKTSIRVIQYRYGLTTTQRNTIVNYLNSKVGNPYGFSIKTDDSTWYCSKLVWRAYMKAGIDIDYDGGAEVTPGDILNSNLLYGYMLN